MLQYEESTPEEEEVAAEGHTFFDFDQLEQETKQSTLPLLHLPPLRRR